MEKLFKIKISSIKDGVMLKGKEALKVPQGSLLRVVKESPSSVGNIIKRMSDGSHPFLTMYNLESNLYHKTFSSHKLWGNNIEKYSFILLPTTNILEYIPYGCYTV